jgi:uncharacterized membrane protein (UPF0182 family)
VGRFVVVAAAVAVVLGLFLVGVGSGLIVDAIWFRHLGYSVVFRTMLGARIACFAVAAGAAFLVVAASGLFVSCCDAETAPRRSPS